MYGIFPLDCRYRRMHTCPRRREAYSLTSHKDLSNSTEEKKQKETETFADFVFLRAVPDGQTDRYKNAITPRYSFQGLQMLHSTQL